jgi:hypothetical protein
MLSFIYRLAIDFEREHGMAPNLLYLNHYHHLRLQSDLPDSSDLCRLLRMEIVVDRQIAHPQVVWSSAARSRAI